MNTIAFCMLTYRPDHPSGIERSIAAVADGVRALGHTAVMIAAGPACDGDDREPGLIRLDSVQLPRPATNDDIVTALADPGAVSVEVEKILREHNVDLVCWGDTLWGLGHLSPAPAGTTTALMAHKVRPSGEKRWQDALAAADLVFPASDFIHDDARAAGLDVSTWTTVPNTLLVHATPPKAEQREQQRLTAPIRIVSRVEPAKGLVELLTEIPEDWSRPVELVLASADFEFWAGMQDDVLEGCAEQAARRPDVISIRPQLSWRDVPPYLAGAAATVISSTEPETFCHTAAEALSGGTPVITFDLGNVPRLVDRDAAGRTVALHEGAAGLWAALAELLDDHDAYHAASRAAPGRVAHLTPIHAAERLLGATNLL